MCGLCTYVRRERLAGVVLLVLAILFSLLTEKKAKIKVD